MIDPAHARTRGRGSAHGGGAGFGLAALVAGLSLAGCASLPVSGPTGKEVLKQSLDPDAAVKITIVELNDAATLPPVTPLPPVVDADATPPPTDLIGPDDVLNIQIYEVGVTLFGGGSPRGSAIGAAQGGSTGAQAQNLGAVRVDDRGLIRLPYAGRLRAAGHTPAELSQLIAAKLKGLSQDPQVVVTQEQTIASSLIVGGEVAKPGRLVLATNRETLSDIVALAGGYRGDAKDLMVRVVRGERSFEFRLSDVLSGPQRDLRIAPGDRVEVLRAPMSFAVLGAASRVEQMPFPAAAISLAEAVAAAGGANPQLGDAKAVFVFRLVPGVDGREVATVYHLNMMHPGAYFLSQRFAIHDKDVLYVGNAGANQPTKLIQLVSQLFSPVIAVESTLVNTGTIK